MKQKRVRELTVRPVIDSRSPVNIEKLLSFDEETLSSLSTWVPLRCTLCQKVYEKKYGEVMKFLRRGNTTPYCSRECSQKHHAVKNRRRCVGCEKPVEKKTKKYCPDCKGKLNLRRLMPKICPVCRQTYQPISSYTVTCSKECSEKLHSRRMRGKGNPRYVHGEEREAIFYKIRPLIRQRDRSTCAVCTGRGKHVHHIDENPRNNIPENLITLCQPCHTIHHKSKESPFPWLAGEALKRTSSMTLKLKERIISLQMEYESTNCIM